MTTVGVLAQKSSSKHHQKLKRRQPHTQQLGHQVSTKGCYETLLFKKKKKLI